MASMNKIGWSHEACGSSKVLADRIREMRKDIRPVPWKYGDCNLPSSWPYANRTLARMLVNNLDLIISVLDPGSEMDREYGPEIIKR